MGSPRSIVRGRQHPPGASILPTTALRRAMQRSFWTPFWCPPTPRPVEWLAGLAWASSRGQPPDLRRFDPAYLLRLLGRVGGQVSPVWAAGRLIQRVRNSLSWSPCWRICWAMASAMMPSVPGLTGNHSWLLPAVLERRDVEGHQLGAVVHPPFDDPLGQRRCTVRDSRRDWRRNSG